MPLSFIYIQQNSQKVIEYENQYDGKDYRSRSGQPDAFRALLRRRAPWRLGYAKDDETRIAVHFSSDHGTSSQNLPARDLRDFAFELRSLLSAPPSATPSAGASVGASAGASDPIVAPND